MRVGPLRRDARRARRELRKSAFGGAAAGILPARRTSAEQAQQRLRRLVGDAQGLRSELLADLQRLELGAFLRQVGIHESAKAAFEGVHLFLVEGDLARDRL